MIKIVISILFSIIALGLYAQIGTPAEQVANKIAVKMKDTLSLSATQQQQVFAINMQLHNQKNAIRNQYPGNDSLIKVSVQRIENKRDSLYRSIIGETNYIIYRQKKRNLVNNN